MGTEAPTTEEVEAGQAAYTPRLLALYDLYVLAFSNRFVWRCPSARMLELYNRLAGARHLDVGVGTGWFLDRCQWPVERPQITLLDLNPSSLQAAAHRIRRYEPRTVRANVLESVELGDVRYDSIGMNFLPHCLPGRLEEKAATVARNLLPYLEPGGVLFGSTVLGRGVRHNAFGRILIRAYNKKGIFSNLADDREGLQRALASSFSSVEIEVVGAVVLFSARA
ncbi:MAG: class I SAM-dependent methyltransferase [Gaiellaceae bacterium]